MYLKTRQVKIRGLGLGLRLGLWLVEVGVRVRVRIMDGVRFRARLAWCPELIRR